MVGIRVGRGLGKQLAVFDPESACQDDKLHNVDPPFTAFNPRDHRLMAMQPACEISLGQTPVLSGTDQGLSQRLVAIAMYRLRQIAAIPSQRR